MLNPKSEYRPDVSISDFHRDPDFRRENPKQYPNVQNQNFKNLSCFGHLKIRISNLFRVSNFVLRISLTFIFVYNAYASSLDKVKIHFLEGDYKSAIMEGEKILALNSYSPDSDELYYILGLSYLKDGNYLRASDIFEIILREFKNSAFGEEAKLGLGDVYFIKGDFVRARDYYKDIINNNPDTRLKSQLYYRLSECAFKLGDAQQGKFYLDKLKQEFPLNFESRLYKDLYVFSDSEFYYTVQVGSFLNITNAENLLNKLNDKGYNAYIQEIDSESRKIYRVRVGKLKSRLEVIQLKDRLTQEGYPTKIVP
jgi:tetratricopeptide (TPR) repeat protein